MTQTFLMGQLRLLLVATLAYAAGKGLITSADSGLLISIATPLGAIAAPWIWSIYTNIGKKLVPKESVAIAKEDTVGGAIVGATIAVPKDVVKVVGCLLAFIFVIGTND